MCSVSLITAAQEIEDVLAKVRACISSGFITFEEEDSEEREKNKNFLQKYEILPRERMQIISELTYKNATEIMMERLKDSERYGNLYVFGIEKELIEKGSEDVIRVPIYIKFQFFDMYNIKDFLLVVSFHEAEEELLYFRWSNT